MRATWTSIESGIHDVWVRCGRGSPLVANADGNRAARSRAVDLDSISVVLTRTADGVRLKHDHRHEDGTPDRVTQYGGDTRAIANPTSLDFFADAHTAELIPTAATNIWTIAIEPDRTFAYALRREAQGRRFRVEFDLSRPVAPPPPPW